MVIGPSIDVRGGRRAYRDGVGADRDPREVADGYVREGATELHLVDLDGAERGEYANFAILAAVARECGARCRLAGGIASLDRARIAAEAGFTSVLFSSAVFAEADLVRRCARLPGAILEIEAREGRLAPRGGPAELVLFANGMDAVQVAAALPGRA